MSVDLQKAFDLPEQTTASIVAHPKILKQSLEAGRSVSCIKTDQCIQYEPRDFSFELTKPSRIIPIWLSLWLNGSKS